MIFLIFTVFDHIDMHIWHEPDLVCRKVRNIFHDKGLAAIHSLGLDAMEIDPFAVV